MDKPPIKSDFVFPTFIIILKLKNLNFPPHPLVMVFLVIWELGYMAVHLETFSAYLQDLSTNDTNRQPTKEIMMLGLCLWKGCFEWCMVIIFRIAFRFQNWQLLPQTAGVQADRHDGNNNQHKILWWILYSTISVFDYMQSHLAVADLLSAQADMNRIQIQSLNMGKWVSDEHERSFIPY